jgi:hypothetical protein
VKLLSTRTHPPVQRSASDVLRMGDGGLRAVLECTSPTARLATALAALSTMPHPVQVVVQSRRSVAEGAGMLARLRFSDAELAAKLRGNSHPFVDRLLVVVPSDLDERDGGEVVLQARVHRVGHRLEQMGLEPVRLRAAALDALSGWDDVEEGRCEVQAADRWARTLLLWCHPGRLNEAWLDSSDTEHDLAVHLNQLAANVGAASTYLTLWSGGLEELDRVTARAETALSVHGVKSRRPYLEAEAAFRASLPMCRELEGPPHRLPVKTSHSLKPGAQGEPRELLYGVDLASLRPLAFDRWALANPNAVVLGEAGSGRSFFLQLELLRARLSGLRAYVIDAGGDHVRAAAAVGGEVIAPVLDGRTPFDPFSLSDGQGSLTARIELLGALFEALAGDLPEVARPILADALAFTYAASGFVDGVDNSERVPPSLGEVMVALELRAVRAAGACRAALEAMVRQLDRYARGDGWRLFERPAARPAEPMPVTVYSLGGLPEEDRAAAILMSLDQVWARLPGERHALVLVDGIDPLLSHETTARLVARLIATAARRGAGMTLAARDVAGILGGPLRERVLEAGMKVLLRQSPEGTALLADAFHLTPAEQSWLLGAPAGEGLLLVEGKRLAFKAIASDEELRLIAEGGAR